MLLGFRSFSVVLTWLHRANIYPERFSPWGPSTLSLLFLVQMFSKSPLVLRPCLPLSLPRRGHYLIKKNSSLTPTLSPPLLFNSSQELTAKPKTHPILPNILTIDFIVTVTVKNIHITTSVLLCKDPSMTVILFLPQTDPHGYLA